jgi:cytochrome P450
VWTKVLAFHVLQMGLFSPRTSGKDELMATTPKLPPGTFGAPYLGQTLQLARDPLTFGRAGMAQYGPVFRYRFIGQRMVALIGEEAQKYVLVSDPANFPAKDGYIVAYDTMGDGILWLDGAPHTAQRKLMTPAFHGRNMEDYLGRINRIVDAQFAEWGASGTRDFYPAAQNIAWRLSMSILLGIEDPTQIDRMTHLWFLLTQGGYAIFRARLPWSKYGKAFYGREQIERILQPIITEHRREAKGDVLSMLVQPGDEGGQLTDAQLQAHLRILIYAGFDTTSSTLAWILVELLRNPKLMERALAEARTGGDPNAHVTLDETRKLPFLDAVIKETLRLHPQTPFAMRGVKASFEFGGYTIPAGWHVALFPVVTHRMAEYFTEPETFDPDRFLERDETKAHPYAWIGFGGGPHSCLGEGVAKLEMKAVLLRLLRRFDLSLGPDQDFTPAYVPLSRPKGDVGIQYTDIVTRKESIAV